MRVEYAFFNTRAARSEYIAKNFAQAIKGKVLDVGCDKAVLKKLIPGLEYTGIDVGGEPDLRINLEEIERLPFDDGSFDCVVCSDVLEHLDNLHHIFGELVRVSKGSLIISLPNNWTNARRPIEKGRGSFDKYGLPADKPVDRHKWFFSLTEAVDFFKGQEKKFPITIEELHATDKPRPAVMRALRKAVYVSEEKYLNRYAHTLWALIKKK